ncbi:MAG TPA: nucleotidyl transferase AbiEii/AbiGii toxin family protein [Bacteroidales bacterium]|nr:nucleotidyl transferase AbiEii/AbiGii toxin family protein [Bacteroidales bacterium]HCI55439.1 nucleotidyl transferase AbiEii/AbiGii toxin family protein [Bacteroidales bacterium]HOU96541.1 nucleotidyl transferase AbiEii/AbiGii toxin family protein [Bacteroidales bacterium]HQG53618.1 nucleotidyl transferase AbiEii/AbiGii toxin family protein [Bacteroidales bacterium]HQJ21138.1 nucleotidyl transferase AbiEii/AbiGii toxin family protein [Bacteroidales bacterium]
MANPVNLHEFKSDFNLLVKETADYFGIREVFIEKDYWITRVLKHLAHSKYSGEVVFKGGTSLSKGYKLIDRFSEDIDIAVINESGMTGNRLKTLIRSVEKTISVDLTEVYTHGVTSKGSQFRKSVFTYPVSDDARLYQGLSNKLIIEINSFANTNPYVNLKIKFLISEFLESSAGQDLIEKYDLQAFNINILDKRRTLIEKIVSLIRFSFSENPIVSISEKVRHFYDIYYLLIDTECKSYLGSEDFIRDITELFKHDRTVFNEPNGWRQKPIIQSPLITDFDNFWKSIKVVYARELTKLAFNEIPNEEIIAKSFKQVINRLKF